MSSSRRGQIPHHGPGEDEYSKLMQELFDVADGCSTASESRDEDADVSRQSVGRHRQSNSAQSRGRTNQQEGHLSPSKESKFDRRKESLSAGVRTSPSEDAEGVWTVVAGRRSGGRYSRGREDNGACSEYHESSDGQRGKHREADGRRAAGIPSSACNQSPSSSRRRRRGRNNRGATDDSGSTSVQQAPRCTAEEDDSLARLAKLRHVESEDVAVSLDSGNDRRHSPRSTCSPARDAASPFYQSGSVGSEHGQDLRSSTSPLHVSGGKNRAVIPHGTAQAAELVVNDLLHQMETYKQIDETLSQAINTGLQEAALAAEGQHQCTSHVDCQPRSPYGKASSLARPMNNYPMATGFAVSHAISASYPNQYTAYAYPNTTHATVSPKRTCGGFANSASHRGNTEFYLPLPPSNFTELAPQVQQYAAQSFERRTLSRSPDQSSVGSRTSQSDDDCLAIHRLEWHMDDPRLRKRRDSSGDSSDTSDYTSLDDQGEWTTDMSQTDDGGMSQTDDSSLSQTDDGSLSQTDGGGLSQRDENQSCPLSSSYSGVSSVSSGLGGQQVMVSAGSSPPPSSRSSSSSETETEQGDSEHESDEDEKTESEDDDDTAGDDEDDDDPSDVSSYSGFRSVSSGLSGRQSMASASSFSLPSSLSSSSTESEDDDDTVDDDDDDDLSDEGEPEGGLFEDDPGTPLGRYGCKHKELGEPLKEYGGARWPHDKEHSESFQVRAFPYYICYHQMPTELKEEEVLVQTYSDKEGKWVKAKMVCPYWYRICITGPFPNDRSNPAQLLSGDDKVLKDNIRRVCFPLSLTIESIRTATEEQPGEAHIDLLVLDDTSALCAFNNVLDLVQGQYYRQEATRLEEWRKHYRDFKEADEEWPPLSAALSNQVIPEKEEKKRWYANAMEAAHKRAAKHIFSFFNFKRDWRQIDLHHLRVFGDEAKCKLERQMAVVCRRNVDPKVSEKYLEVIAGKGLHSKEHPGRGVLTEHVRELLLGWEENEKYGAIRLGRVNKGSLLVTFEEYAGMSPCYGWFYCEKCERFWDNDWVWVQLNPDLTHDRIFEQGCWNCFMRDEIVNWITPQKLSAKRPKHARHVRVLHTTALPSPRPGHDPRLCMRCLFLRRTQPDRTCRSNSKKRYLIKGMPDS